jgi:hypothetical protein
MTAAEQHHARRRGDHDDVRVSASPQPRLGVKDALSICLAMVDDDRSLHHAAIGMWHALAPFVPTLTRARNHDLAEIASAVDEWLARTGTHTPL